MPTYDVSQIFNKLQRFYILIFIHDLQDFELKDLHGLLMRLEGKLELDQKQKKIHEHLTRQSDQNYKQKKEKKKKAAKNANSEPSFLKTLEKSHQVDDFNNDSLSIEQSVLYPKNILSQNWVEEGKFSGIIYDGKLTIVFTVKYKEKSIQKVSFQVDGSQKQSSISVATLQKITKAEKFQTISLQISKRKHEFEVFGNKNIIGLDFLNKHKVILNCNYRPQIHKFTLLFTS